MVEQNLFLIKLIVLNPRSQDISFISMSLTELSLVKKLVKCDYLAILMIVRMITSFSNVNTKHTDITHDLVIKHTSGGPELLCNCACTLLRSSMQFGMCTDSLTSTYFPP